MCIGHHWFIESISSPPEKKTWPFAYISHLPCDELWNAWTFPASPGQQCDNVLIHDPDPWDGKVYLPHVC